MKYKGRLQPEEREQISLMLSNNSTMMQVYFCDPHSPWQRGTNENTNGLVRGFFPKGTDFNLVTKEKLNWVQNALNERPRQTLEFNTPKETFNSLLLKY